ncbi:hypothetical protein BH10PSE7_BH10PSE7_37880 [soil metagenome]
MTVFKKKIFGKENVVLDENEFDECKFDGTKLIYRGGTPPNLKGCDFANSIFFFDGPASNTVAFLKGMSGPRSGLQKVVRQTFPAFSGH